MTLVADIARWLDGIAPCRLAESWDNVGLLWGDPAAPVERVMTCLSVTPESAAEAVEERASLIVSHHPVLFRALKAVRADQVEGAALWKLARAGVAILSAHTAFDNATGGINDGLARRLGLVDVGPLRPSPAADSFKIIVFAPRSDRERVLAAAFEAGAGRIGAYEECSFSSAGYGTFFGTEGANPTIGQAGRRETVREWRIEIICSAGPLAAVLSAIRANHSYEEPAIDVIKQHAPPGRPGIGRLGRLERPEPLEALATRTAKALGATCAQLVGTSARPVSRVAIACGAGDDFVLDAARAGADVLLTGEARFHQALAAKALGLALILPGHHATERPGVEDLAELIRAAFPALTVWPSQRETDPLRAVNLQENP
jgi:dinuclear metal center YbgI/SA1388 family protein